MDTSGDGELSRSEVMPSRPPPRRRAAWHEHDAIPTPSPSPSPNPEQVIRAFRLDDELRDMMLPLLNVPADKFSVTGVNVKAQVRLGLPGLA